MKSKTLLSSTLPVIFFALILLAGCAQHNQPYSPDFNFKHVKAEQCDEFWLSFERLVKDEGARCSELIQIDGFPYLRGTDQLISTGLELKDKKARARWLEMMRTADMQARYRELDTLSDNAWALLCSEANIYNCEAGRLKAFTARCSALLLGDERLNPDFYETLHNAASGALSRGYPEEGRKCFQDRNTLDGTLPDNILKALTDPDGGYRGGASLKRRVNTIKSLTPSVKTPTGKIR